MSLNLADTIPPGPPTPRNPDTLPTLALVLAWSKQEPERVGEVAFFPFDEPRVIGERGSADFPSALFGRQRLGPIVEPQTPVACVADAGRAIARVQVHRGDAFTVRCLGPEAMLVNGEPCLFAELEPGDTVTLDDQAVFVCVRRPALMIACDVEVPYFGELDSGGFLGESWPIWELRHTLCWTAQHERNVLVLGAAGTGHAAAAAFLHRASPRAAGPLLSVDALPCLTGNPTVPLFQQIHDYAATCDAVRAGLIAEGDQGTLVLSELGAVDAGDQWRLAQVLDSPHPRPVGSSELAIIATTTGSRGSIDKPIFYRFRMHVQLPSLRDRPEDIPLLARRFLKNQAASSPEFAERFFRVTPHGTREPRVTARLTEYLVRHPLPRNIDQLEELLLEALRTSPADEVDLTDAVAERDGSSTSEHPASVGAVA